MIILFRPDGSFVASTVTDSDGDYEFVGLPAGSYIVFEFNLDGYDDVSDTDGPNDNRIFVDLNDGEKSPDNDFVDEKMAMLSTPTPYGATTTPTLWCTGINHCSDFWIAWMTCACLTIRYELTPKTSRLISMRW